MNTTTIDDIEKRLARALPGPKALKRQEQQDKFNVVLICGSAVGISLLGGLIIALAVGKSPLSQTQTDPVQIAKQKQWTLRDPYIEKLYRSDRTPVAFNPTSEPGWIQQTAANIGAEIKDKAESDRNTPNHPAYRQPIDVALAFYEVNANEILLLASMGAGNPHIYYFQPNGTKITRPLSPSEFAYFGLGQLGAIDLAQNLEVHRTFSLTGLVSQVGILQAESRSGRVAALKAQGLVDAAAELQKIQAFRKEF